MSPQKIIRFWMDEVGEKRWFQSDPHLDREIAQRFGRTHRDAVRGDLATWENSAEGSLALVLLLDQFPRNMFRGEAEAFACDALARRVADRAVANDFDLKVPSAMRTFFYLPFMHSESLADQDRCVALIGERLGTGDSNYPHALDHRKTIARFGRFPARNAALGRQSTPAELDFLIQASRS